jgi:hypothetical protein
MTTCTTCGNGDHKYYVGDVGTEIIVDTCHDISAATKVSLKVEKPDGIVYEWIGSIYQTTKIRYVIRAGDLDQAGKYLVQAYVKLGAWSGHGTTSSFMVSILFG